MIPGTGYQVRYQRAHAQPSVRPVIAFGDDGDALVVDDREQAIVRARSLQDFASIERVPAPVVAAVPGGGWRVRRMPDGVEPYTETVVTWLVYADGEVAALTCDPTGATTPVRGGATPFTMVPPEEVPPAR